MEDIGKERQTSTGPSSSMFAPTSASASALMASFGHRFLFVVGCRVAG
jgi:hypothetical protein